jgi:hypothetical protein
MQCSTMCLLALHLNAKATAQTTPPNLLHAQPLIWMCPEERRYTMLWGASHWMLLAAASAAAAALPGARAAHQCGSSPVGAANPHARSPWSNIPDLQYHHTPHHTTDTWQARTFMRPFSAVPISFRTLHSRGGPIHGKGSSHTPPVPTCCSTASLLCLVQTVVRSPPNEAASIHQCAQTGFQRACSIWWACSSLVLTLHIVPSLDYEHHARPTYRWLYTGCRACRLPDTTDGTVYPSSKPSSTTSGCCTNIREGGHY